MYDDHLLTLVSSMILTPPCRATGLQEIIVEERTVVKPSCQPIIFTAFSAVSRTFAGPRPASQAPHHGHKNPLHCGKLISAEYIVTGLAGLAGGSRGKKKRKKKEDVERKVEAGEECSSSMWGRGMSSSVHRHANILLAQGTHLMSIVRPSPSHCPGGRGQNRLAMIAQWTPEPLEHENILNGR